MHINISVDHRRSTQQSRGPFFRSLVAKHIRDRTEQALLRIATVAPAVLGVLGPGLIYESCIMGTTSATWCYSAQITRVWTVMACCWVAINCRYASPVTSKKRKRTQTEPQLHSNNMQACVRILTSRHMHIPWRRAGKRACVGFVMAIRRPGRRPAWCYRSTATSPASCAQSPVQQPSPISTHDPSPRVWSCTGSMGPWLNRKEPSPP